MWDANSLGKRKIPASTKILEERQNPFGTETALMKSGWLLTATLLLPPWMGPQHSAAARGSEQPSCHHRGLCLWGAASYPYPSKHEDFAHKMGEVRLHPSFSGTMASSFWLCFILKAGFISQLTWSHKLVPGLKQEFSMKWKRNKDLQALHFYSSWDFKPFWVKGKYDRVAIPFPKTNAGRTQPLPFSHLANGSMLTSISAKQEGDAG